MRGLRLLLPILLLAAGCRPKPSGPAIYGAWEEGLTLTFEDPSEADPRAREEGRFQVRVEKGLADPTRPGAVLLRESNLRASYAYAVRYEQGGKALFGEDGKLVAWVLPQGFPEQTPEWRDDKLGLAFKVLGSAAWEGDAIKDVARKGLVDPIGTWVEVRRRDGLLRRTLYLKGLGEVESLEWRDGKWIAINRLTGRGFTDLPKSR